MTTEIENAAEVTEALREKSLHELNQEAAEHITAAREYRQKTIDIVLKIVRKREGDEVGDSLEKYLIDILSGKVISSPRPKSVRAPIRV